MDQKPGTRIVDIPIDRVFIGSCSNGQIEDLRAAAGVLTGRRISRSLKQALVVPASTPIKRQAEAEGLDRIFVDAGFEWRDSGCSMCIAMNEDVLPPGERCASTSNRNFEGRQGKGGRTHLVSPAMAAAAAIAGHFVDVRDMQFSGKVPESLQRTQWGGWCRSTASHRHQMVPAVLRGTRRGGGRVCSTTDAGLASGVPIRISSSTFPLPGRDHRWRGPLRLRFRPLSQARAVRDYGFRW
jgi:hypothetical protein